MHINKAFVSNYRRSESATQIKLPTNIFMNLLHNTYITKSTRSDLTNYIKHNMKLGRKIFL